MLGFGFIVWDLGFGAWGVWALGFRVQRLGCLRFRYAESTSNSYLRVFWA